MRIAIISDIHGNQLALEAVLRDLAEQPPVDQTVIAGDLCLNGPCPREVLAIVQGLHCPVLRGNVDEEVVTAAPGKGEKKRSTATWTREQIGPEGIRYLASLPLSHRVHNPGSSDLLVVHANPLNLEDAIFPNAEDGTLEHLLGGLDANIGALAFGHLHIAYTRRWRRFLLVDVGSCGIPRDEDLRAAYGILSWQKNSWEAEIRRVEYDVRAVVKQIKASGMPNAEKRIRTLLEARY
ncbi:MAG TPA: metallophosphoesterase family protein [Ktedonobacteraceae bacterium]|jgi:putative phosphoesterase|nr:metallophosphoesterase family protein [Ktedonobacteraceae bacterium]